MAFLSENGLTKVATVSGIDATVLTSTTLFNVPADKVFIPNNIVIRPTSFTVGSKSIEAVASVGGNSPNFNDYISGRTFTVSGVGNVIVSRSADDAEYTSQVPSSVFAIIVDTASDATTETWAVDVFGYML